jgi:GMP synthase-like glutamine amidotransferase
MAKPKRIHFLQHVSYEGLGGIDSWIQAQGVQLNGTRFFEEVALPDTASVQALIVMGGPMSVHDEAKFKWLAAEKKFIEQVIRDGKPVLGICLGAQLIADVLGARVYPAAHREIGWFPVELTDKGKSDRIMQALPPVFTGFHWHGETFDIPDGAVHLARSAACENQAFSYNGNVLALQFHPEVTVPLAQLLVMRAKEDLKPGEFVQTETEILGNKNGVRQNGNYIVGLMNALMNQ